MSQINTEQLPAAAFTIQDELKRLAAPLTVREEKFCYEYLATGG